MGRGNPSNRNNLATVINSVENRLAQNTVVLGSPEEARLVSSE